MSMVHHQARRKSVLVLFGIAVALWGLLGLTQLTLGGSSTQLNWEFGSLSLLNQMQSYTLCVCKKSLQKTREGNAIAFNYYQAVKRDRDRERKRK